MALVVRALCCRKRRFLGAEIPPELGERYMFGQHRDRVMHSLCDPVCFVYSGKGAEVWIAFLAEIAINATVDRATPATC